MKKLVLASTITALTLNVCLFGTTRHKQQIIAQSVCEYVAADDKKRMRSFLKSNKLKIRSIFGGIQCNGKNLLEFAAANDSVKTGSMIIKKLSKKVIVAANLASSIQSGSQPLVDAANARVSS